MSRIKKVAILYSGLSGYAAACQRALKDNYSVKLMVVHWPTSSEAPFQDKIYSHIDLRVEKKDINRSNLLAKVLNFQPDAVLVSGWMDKDYLRVARILKKHNIPIVASSDTQWTGSVRQRIAVLISQWYLHSAFNVLWVTGERQKQLANKLGFTGLKCWNGFYSCNWQQFKPNYSGKRAKVFLYVGRYIPRKGLDTLVMAYRKYRELSSDPWELWTVGTGEIQSILSGEEGIINKGFVQPNELPELMHQVSCFIMPSRVEPWGVAIHEATAAGLPIICSDACGASVHLLKDYFNGFTFETENIDHLTLCLEKISCLPKDKWEEMSKNSTSLSEQYTPEIWAKTFIEGLKNLDV